MVSLHLPAATGVVLGKGDARLPGAPPRGSERAHGAQDGQKPTPLLHTRGGGLRPSLGPGRDAKGGHPQTTGRGLPGHMPLRRPAEGSAELMAGKWCSAEPHREPRYREPPRTPSAPPAQRLPRANGVKQTRGWGGGPGGAGAPHPGLRQEPLSRRGCMSLQASAITGRRGGHGVGGHSSMGGGPGPSPPPAARAEKPPAGPGAEDGPRTAARRGGGTTGVGGGGASGPRGLPLGNAAPLQTPSRTAPPVSWGQRAAPPCPQLRRRGRNL